MTTAYLIVASAAALAFVATGLLKLVRSKAALAASGLAWVEEFSAGAVKLIGVAEVVGAVGLLVPMLTGAAVFLSPVAAVCLALLMVGATVVHVRRHEPPFSLVALVLAVAAAVLGFLALA